MKTVNDVEVQLSESEQIREPLRNLGLLNDGYRCSVRLHRGKREKRRTASFEKNWSPETDSICISFEPISAQPSVKAQTANQEAASTPSKSSQQADDNPLSDLVRTLDAAESRPGYKFVALKWFRDVALPSAGFTWSNAESVRRILSDAIDRRLILISKVPNPKSPQFPVTAIRLNRLMPEVAAILGIRETGVRDFRPVPIRGEGLSATVVSDRR